MPRSQTAGTASGGLRPPPNQVGGRTPLSLVPPPNQVGDWTAGTVSGGQALPKQVRNRTPPPPPKQRKDQTVGTASGGVVPPRQVGNRTPGSVPPSPNQAGNRRLATLSGGVLAPRQVGNRSPVSVPPSPNQAGNRRLSTLSGGEVPPRQVGNRSPVPVPPSPDQAGNPRLSTLSGGEVLPRQVGNPSPLSVQLPPKQHRDHTVCTLSYGEMARKQVGNRTPSSLLPQLKQHRDHTVGGTVSGGEVLRKQVGNRAPSSLLPQLKQHKDHTVGGTVSGGEVLRKQVGNRTPSSLLPQLKQRMGQMVGGTVSCGEVLRKQVGNRTPLPVLPPLKQRRDQTAGIQQGRPASSSKSSACAALRGNTSLHARKSSAAPNKTIVQVKPKKNKDLEEAQDEIQRLNKLGLGDNVSETDYRLYLNQLPRRPDVDISTELDAVQLKELNVRHALCRIKYYQLSQNVPEEMLCYDKLKEDYPPSCLEERFFKCYEEDGKLDWSFHPDYCKLAGLDDYQRLVPQNYGGYEYVGWDEYHKEFHSYEIEQEYIKYCEELSKKLKWMEAYVLKEQTSIMRGMILSRGTYQAMKIATGFSKIHANLAFSGFYEWFDSMAFDVTNYNEFDGLYYEIWQRCTKEKKFRDALDEVYELNRFPLSQNRMRCALENDTFCSEFEEEFLAFTACLKEFAEDKSQIAEDKALELIAEALRKETPKPKFYEDYCRKKIDIAQAIGLISSVPS